MEVSLKVGSVLRVPVLAGFAATSTDTGVISVSISGNILGITAVKTGNSWVTLTVAPDLKVGLNVAVVAS